MINHTKIVNNYILYTCKLIFNNYFEALFPVLFDNFHNVISRLFVPTNHFLT